LQEGNIFPRWAGNLNWGYGHPILMFLYPLPSYIASLFHFLGFSFVDSTKLVFAVAFFSSGLIMYLWLKSFLSEKAAFVGAILYAFAPYHFVDLYVRGAIGEMVAFIFPPLVFYFLLKLSEKNSYRNILGISVSLACFILAHNAVSLMFLPFLIFYILYLTWTINKRFFFLRNACLAIFFGFALSAFFWLPALMEGKYTLRDIVTNGEYAKRFIQFSKLLYGAWNYGQSGSFTVQVGLLQWLSFIAAIPLTIRFYKARNKQWLLLFGVISFFCLSLFLMIQPAKSVWDAVSILQKFQFPWRFLSLSIFTASVFGAFAFQLIPKKREKTGIILFTVATLLITIQMWQAKAYVQKPELFYSGIYNGTTDTGESSPIWSVRFMEDKPKAHLESIGGGQVIVQEGKRTSTVHTYTVTALQRIQLRENTLYFPGWEILIDNKSVPPQFQDTHNRGVMTFFVDKGRHNLLLQFKETKLRLWSEVVSIISLFLLPVLGILRRRILWQN